MSEARETWWEGRRSGGHGGGRAGWSRDYRRDHSDRQGWNGWEKAPPRDWAAGNDRADHGGAASSGHSWKAAVASTKSQVPEALALCNSAKTRLVAQRAQLQEAQVATLTDLLRQKPKTLPDSLLESGFEEKQLEDLRCVLSNDHWDDTPCSGAQWLSEWLFDGERWATLEAAALEQGGGGGAHWCFLCRRDFYDEWGLSSHEQSRDHQKKFRTWVWRLGRPPPSGSDAAAPRASQGVAARTIDGPSPPAAAEGEAVDLRPAVRSTAGPENKRFAKVKADQLLARARADAEGLPAIAKQRLVHYRDSLSEEQRCAIVKKIGLPRANDVSSLEVFSSVFNEQVYQWMCEVKSEEWLWREPTFSWLSGFYWHPESTRLSQGGPVHTPLYCHLCEVDCYDTEAQKVHLMGRRHAETLTIWVERMGATPIPSSCSRCPRQGEAVEEHRPTGELPPMDVECCGSEDSPRTEPPEETNPPVGFDSVTRGDIEPPTSFPYVAFTVRPQPTADRTGPRPRQGRKHNASPGAESWSGVKVVSSRLRIGVRVGAKTQKRGQTRWGVDLQAPLDFETWSPEGQWRSLAVPLRGNSVSEGASLGFGILLQHTGHEELEEAGKVNITVPPRGHVLVAVVEVPAQRQGSWGSSAWAQVVETRTVPLHDFVATGQVEAFGGAQALRGSQRAFQLATEEIMMSFLMYFPVPREPAPLLLFLHGDLPRDSAQCPMPGIADFADQYGPAELCGTRRRKGSHTARDFIVVTPCSPAEVWWFRHPALHDATTYVPSVERWFRRLAAWLENDLAVSLPSNVSSGADAGIRLAGQSMGGYAALELARAMPEMVAAVACGAPCFDACRLDWLASRIKDVPLWIMIGRHDSMCAFEESASLVLKLRDRGARFARLTSFGIKGHTEAFKLLEKPLLYRWLRNPFGNS